MKSELITLDGGLVLILVVGAALWCARRVGRLLSPGKKGCASCGSCQGAGFGTGEPLCEKAGAEQDIKAMQKKAESTE